jgi:hypothetical protein
VVLEFELRALGLARQELFLSSHTSKKNYVFFKETSHPNFGNKGFTFKEKCAFHIS